jgi:hypothetical protein
MPILVILVDEVAKGGEVEAVEVAEAIEVGEVGAGGGVGEGAVGDGGGGGAVTLAGRTGLVPDSRGYKRPTNSPT